MRETKAQIMAGVRHHDAKLICNNTVRYVRPDGTIAIRYHHTDIMVIDSWLGTKQLFTGGWRTVTTKERLNIFLGKDGYITQRKFNWYFNDEEFFEGMIVRDGKILNPKVKPLW